MLLFVIISLFNTQNYAILVTIFKEICQNCQVEILRNTIFIQKNKEEIRININCIRKVLLLLL